MHASDFYLGFGELPEVVAEGQALPLALVAARPDGQPEADRKSAKLRVTLVEWQNTRVETAGHASEYRNEPRFTVVTEMDVQTQPLAYREHKWMVADEAQRIALTAGKPGLYLLEARAQDAAGILSHGQRQWLEIGMLMMQDPELLLVDEPVAGMTDAETEHTAALLARIAGKHSVVVVEHDLEFVRALRCRVTVLHEGSVLSEGSIDHVQNDPRVVEVYLGR